MLDLIRRERGWCENGQVFDWLREIGIEIEEQKVIATYDYVDSEGTPLYRVTRWGPRKAFTQSRFDSSQGRFLSGKGCMEGVRLVPYRLPQLASAERVLIVEGEKDADRLFENGIVATCNPGGAGKWTRDFAPYFRSRHVVIMPDNDEAGRAHARDVADCLEPVVSRVSILELPDLPAKGDVSDWLEAGRTIDELSDLVQAAPDAGEVIRRWRASDASKRKKGAAGDEGTEEGKRSIATTLVEIAKARADLFMTPGEVGYASFEVEGHRETWPLRSRGFRHWLGRQFYDESKGKRAASAQAIADALVTLEGLARYCREYRPGCRTRFAGSPPAAAGPAVSCTPMMKRF
jgi:hypothetical protein